MTPASKLVPVSEVQQRLVLPTTGAPIRMDNVMKIIKVKLGFEPVLQKIDGKGQAVNHITEEQAAQVEHAFRLHHHKKFKAAESK